jgi:hypothetical protein
VRRSGRPAVAGAIGSGLPQSSAPHSASATKESIGVETPPKTTVRPVVSTGHCCTDPEEQLNHVDVERLIREGRQGAIGRGGGPSSLICMGSCAVEAPLATTPGGNSVLRMPEIGKDEQHRNGDQKEQGQAGYRGGWSNDTGLRVGHGAEYQHQTDNEHNGGPERTYVRELDIPGEFASNSSAGHGVHAPQT